MACSFTLIKAFFRLEVVGDVNMDSVTGVENNVCMEGSLLVSCHCKKWPVVLLKAFFRLEVDGDVNIPQADSVTRNCCGELDPCMCLQVI